MSAYLLAYAAVIGVAIAIRPELYRAFLLTAWALLILAIGLEINTP